MMGLGEEKAKGDSTMEIDRCLLEMPLPGQAASGSAPSVV